MDTQALIHALKTDPKWEGRRDAAEALGKEKAFDAVPDLIFALENDASWVVQFICAEALAAIGDERAIEPIYQGIQRMKSDPTNYVTEHYFKALSQLGENGYQRLVEVMQDRTSPLRSRAPEILFDVDSAKAIPFLLDAVRQADIDIAKTSCVMLGRSKDPQSFDVLTAALENPMLRSSAAFGLKMLGMSEAVPYLEKYVDDANPDVRKRINEVLADLGWKPTDSSSAIKSLIEQGKYQEALDQYGEAAIPSMIPRFHPTESNYDLREALVKAGPAAVGPLSAAMKDAQPRVQLEFARVLSRIDDPEAKKQAENQLNIFKDAFRAYWKGMGVSWWDRNNPTDACCDSCNGDVSRENAFYFVQGRRLKCRSCCERSLIDWNLTWEYFGSSELDNALKYKPEPILETKKQPRFTLYAFEVRAGSAGAAMGAFGRTVVMEAGDDELKEMIRVRSNCMDSAVEIIAPADWSAPAIAQVAVPAIQQALPDVNRKVIAYLNRCGMTNVSEAGLLATGNILPNPVSGRILFVYRFEGTPLKPQPQMKPSLAANQPVKSAAGKPGPKPEKKPWWQFWKK